METYRTTMDKVLSKQEDSKVITNPKEPVRTILRKTTFRLAYLKYRAKRLIGLRAK